MAIQVLDPKASVDTLSMKKKVFLFHACPNLIHTDDQLWEPYLIKEPRQMLSPPIDLQDTLLQRHPHNITLIPRSLNCMTDEWIQHLKTMTVLPDGDSSPKSWLHELNVS